MEDYSETVRFILTCNYPNKIIPPIHSRVQQLHIVKTDHTEFTARAATVLVAENIQFDIDTLDTYVIGPLKTIVREIYAVGAGMVALAQGKNPFTAYNDAIKAFDGVKVFGDVKTIQTELNVKAEEEKKTREATKAVVTGINEEQQKVLDGLTKSVAEQQLNNEYLKNRLVYGDEEAKKMKLVADFNQKIKEREFSMKMAEMDREDAFKAEEHKRKLEELAMKKEEREEPAPAAPSATSGAT
jgi:DNA polymerase III delta prime subunit